MTEPGTIRRDRQVRLGLLEEVTRTAAYPARAEALPGCRPAPPRTTPARAGRAAIAVAVAIGLILGLAAATTRQGRGDRAQERDALLAQVARAEDRHDALAAHQEGLAVEIARLRDHALGQGAAADATRARLDNLGIAAGTTAATGAGIVVTLDDASARAKDSRAQAKGRVLDVDLRHVVNGLWQAGAEAVTVNGQRLTATTAIRSAGEAITVNYRSLARPYRVEAIGDPGTLPARFAATPGGQWLAYLRSNYGVQATNATARQLQLPAAAEPPLRHARRKEA